MPVIASQTIKVDVKEDKTIQVILLKELKKSRCISLADMPVNVNNKQELYNIVKQLVGEKVITCDKDTCCISDNYFGFVKKMGVFKQ